MCKDIYGPPCIKHRMQLHNTHFRYHVIGTTTTNRRVIGNRCSTGGYIAPDTYSLEFNQEGSYNFQLILGKLTDFHRLPISKFLNSTLCYHFSFIPAISRLVSSSISAPRMSKNILTWSSTERRPRGTLMDITRVDSNHIHNRREL